MANVKNKNLYTVAKVAVIILFVVLAIIVANSHEHWSDEAQSFLIARDNSFSEIMYYIGYEGTPPLWFFVIKIFILLGGTYQSFYILPIVFSTIGITIFEFKIKAPWYIKIIFPFTYFIFYQYTIVDRSYCLVFPTLMLIAYFYNKRFDKPIIYALILFVFMNISLHTMVIAGSFYLLFLIDIFKEKKIKNKKIIISCILIFLELLCTLLYTIPNKDCSFGGNGGAPIIHIISEATIGNKNKLNMEEIIRILLVIAVLMAIKEKKIVEVLRLVILVLPVIMVLKIITYQVWHVGVIFLLLFTYCIISDLINSKKIVKISLLVILIVQTYWSICTTNYDINNNYSASKDAATFLKEIDCQDKTTYGIGYYVTAIAPYFENNIFKNVNTNKSFYLWKTDKDEIPLDEIVESEADIYIIPIWDEYEDIVEELEKENYDKYNFYGNTYVKTRTYEKEGYYIFVKK